jgi:hypothetical protein
MGIVSMNWSTKEVVTIVIAAVGAVLGTLNTAFALWQKRVRLRVRVLMTLERENRVCVDVTNLSEFPVTIQSVGFVLDAWYVRILMKVPGLGNIAGKLSRGYLVIKNPAVTGRGLDEHALPARLLPRDSLTAVGNAHEHLKPEFRQVRRAFALTACGVMQTARYPNEFKILPRP